MVSDFLSKAQLLKQGNTYLFAVATYYLIVGNSISQANALFKEKGGSLNYGAKIKMFGNVVTSYNMNSKVDEITRKSDERAKSVVQNIVNKKVQRIPSINQLLYRPYLKFISVIPQQTKNFLSMMIASNAGYARMFVRQRISH